MSIRLAEGFQRYSAPNFILVFLTLEKLPQYLIAGVHVLSICCQKFIIARQALQKNRQEAVDIVVVVPRLQY